MRDTLPSRKAAMSTQLAAVAESQGRWSATADALKKRYDSTRSSAFVLSIAAALLAAVSSQVDGTPRSLLAGAGAVCMALVTFLSSRFLDAGHARTWVRARAASEALKREGYKRAAQAAPYESPADADRRLREEAKKIESDVDDLLTERVSAGKSSLPLGPITPDEYIDRRVRDQVVKYFEPRADAAQARARTFRRLEFGLAGVTTIITASVSIIPKERLAGFDLAALVAVLTTLSGAIVAFIEASRYDFVVQSYRATSRQLRDQLNNPPADPVPGTPEWSAFVEQCEAILQQENSSWIAKFGKPSS